MIKFIQHVGAVLGLVVLNGVVMVLMPILLVCEWRDFINNKGWEVRQKV
jgi:hypothetical protein